ncbi:MAG: tetratricopeptide repeat protein [Pirellulales bacterium]|nr:tetratricopeptide repeat protein [Pirellulales bacterium]
MSPRFGIFILVLLPAVPAGCRIPGREGPVSQPLAESRRLSQQGVSAMDRGDGAQAESLLAQAVATCPVDSEARRRYAEALWNRGAQGEAIAQLEQAAPYCSEDPAFWVRLAEMQLGAGRTDEAGKCVQQALHLDPKLAAAWAIRARVMRAAGYPQQALADNLRTLGYAPHDRKILLEIAELYRELNQPDRALQTLQALSDTYAPGEEPVEVPYLTGLAYSALGRYDDAVTSLTAAVCRGPATPEMYCRLAEAHLLAGRLPEAAQSVRQALAMDPQHAPSRELLGRIEIAARPRQENFR